MKKNFILPVLIMIFFCFIAIVGKKTAGFFVEYLIIGLFHGTATGIIGIAGILAIFSGLLLPPNANRHLFYLTGIACMIISIIFFFYFDKEKYNYPTFKDPISLSSFTLFTLTIFLFIKQILHNTKISMPK